MRNDSAPFCYLFVAAEEHLAKDRFHVRPGGLLLFASPRGPVVHHVGEQLLHSCRSLLDVIEGCAGIGIEAAGIGLRQQLTE